MAARTRALVVTALCALTSARAYAQGPPPVSSTAAKPAELNHKGQFELSLRLPIGLRVLVPYDNEYCGKADPQTSTGNAPVCAARAPFSMDLEVGYGVTTSIDLLLELRIGLERNFSAMAGDGDGPRAFHVSPGARFFFSDSGRSKLFTTAQLVVDFTGFEDPSGASLGTDYGVRNVNGLWFDLHPMYGVYGFLGEVLTLSRWMRFELELGIGFQGRYR